MDLQTILAGLAMVVVGLVGAFFGYRLFRILLPLYGAVFGFVVAWGWWGEQAWLLALVAGLVFAAILAVLAYWIWSAFITLAGVILGLGLGAVIGTSLNLWSWLTGLLALALGALFGYLFMRYRNLMVIVSTGLTGAATTARGVAEFFGLSGGFDGAFPSALLTIVMAAVFAVVAVLGLAFQLRRYRDLHLYDAAKTPEPPAAPAATSAPAATRGATLGTLDAGAGVAAGAGAGAAAVGAAAVAGVAVAAEAAREEAPAVTVASEAVAEVSGAGEAASEVAEEAPEAAAEIVEEAGEVVEEAPGAVAAQVSEAGEVAAEVDAEVPEAGEVAAGAAEGAGGGLAAGVALGAMAEKAGEESPVEADNLVEDAIKEIEDTFSLDDIAKFKEKLEFVEGIGPAFAEKLQAVGINNVLDLLRKGSTRKGRQELMEATGITGKLILKWVNHADLFRIKGVGSEYADLLEAAGVDTVVELGHRNPVNLYNAVVETNKVKNLVRKEPVASQVEDWVDQAKKLPRMIQY